MDDVIILPVHDFKRVYNQRVDTDRFMASSCDIDEISQAIVSEDFDNWLLFNLSIFLSDKMSIPDTELNRTLVVKHNLHDLRAMVKEHTLSNPNQIPTLSIEGDFINIGFEEAIDDW